MNREAVKQGAADLDTQDFINAFLAQKCTIMVPTFSDIYEARPLKNICLNVMEQATIHIFLKKVIRQM